MEDPWTWMGQYANSWRSGPDHHDSWDQRTYGTASIIEHNADLGKYAGMLNLMVRTQSPK